MGNILTLTSEVDAVAHELDRTGPQVQSKAIYSRWYKLPEHSVLHLSCTYVYGSAVELELAVQVTRAVAPHVGTARQASRVLHQSYRRKYRVNGYMLMLKLCSRGHGLRA